MQQKKINIFYEGFVIFTLQMAYELLLYHQLWSFDQALGAVILFQLNFPFLSV